MMSGWRTATRVVFAALALTAGAFTAGPASAQAVSPAPAEDMSVQGEPGPYQIRNQDFGTCLDADFIARWTIDVTPCNAGDSGQRWIMWNRGWTKLAGTNLCLTGSSLIGQRRLSLFNCTNNHLYQYWETWSNGYNYTWFQNLSNRDICLAAYANYTARTDVCVLAPNMYWRVTLW